ncbi:MAG: tRNA dihydrouridine synthase DusB [Pseudomonadota bacterium]|nr:tRNA dihydrouridine synthase DusB [Pseudomonadota bacterium]
MTEQALLAHLKSNPYVLAPMAGITDCAFRTFMKEMGAGIVITELVSAMGLKYCSTKTKMLMAFDEVQRPFGIQLFGETPEILAEAAKESQDFGADFIDLNFGCPVAKVVRKGAGAAVLRDLITLRNILRTVKQAIQIPLTIKVRTGWDNETRNADEVVRLAHDEGITWVTIHGRTRAQGYSGLSDWDYISWVKAQSRIPVLGNGDVSSAGVARMRLDQSKCDGVMIGRGCLKNPYIFHEALSGTQVVEKNYAALSERLQELYYSNFPERYALIQLRKFAMWQSTGLPDSSKFRGDIFSATTKEALNSVIESYFLRVQNLIKEDTSHQAFLMGGHG